MRTNVQPPFPFATNCLLPFLCRWRKHEVLVDDVERRGRANAGLNIPGQGLPPHPDRAGWSTRLCQRGRRLCLRTSRRTIANRILHRGDTPPQNINGRLSFPRILVSFERVTLLGKGSLFLSADKYLAPFFFSSLPFLFSPSIKPIPILTSITCPPHSTSSRPSPPSSLTPVTLSVCWIRIVSILCCSQPFIHFQAFLFLQAHSINMIVLCSTCSCCCSVSL